MGLQRSESLALDFGQVFHGKYWNNECEICSVCQQQASQWSHCSNIFFLINWKLCETRPFCSPVSLGSPPSVGQVENPLRKLYRLRRNRTFLRFLRVPSPFKLGKNYSWLIAQLQHYKVWGKVVLPGLPAWLNGAQHWAPEGQLDNGIFVNPSPFQPLSTPVILGGMVRVD